MAKEGSTVVKVLFVEVATHMCCEPIGWSGNPQIGYAKSILDYVGPKHNMEYLFRWLELRFLNEQGQSFESILPSVHEPPPPHLS